MRLLPLLLGAALLVAGCSGPRPQPPLRTTLPAAFPHHTVDQIRQHLILTSDTLEAFEARANLAVTSPSRSGRFSAEVRSRRGDSLYMSISPGLGIEAARALITQDSVFFYDRLKNRITYSTLEEATDLFAIPLSGENTFRNLLGLVVPAPDVAWQLEADSAFYYLRHPAGTPTYTIDPSLWRVTRYEERLSSGELVEERVFSDFGVFDGLYLPRRVLFRRPPEASTVSFYYRSLDLNPAQLSFALQASGSAQRVPAGTQ